MMKECEIYCPHCGEKLKIVIQDDEISTLIVGDMMNKNSISQKELRDKYNIELGVIEGGE